MTARKPKSMTDDELSAALDAEIWQADGWDGDELSSNREQALLYFKGDSKAAPSMTGRAQVQSLDVADMHGAVLAAMMPAFEIDDLVQFEPTSAQDVDQARLESDAVNYTVMQANDGYMLFKEAIHDALLLRNGLVKVWVDERTETTTDEYEGLTDMEALQVRGPDQQNQDTEILRDEAENGLRNLTVRRTTTTRDLKVTAIDPTDFVWSQNHDSLSLERVPFCAERTYPSRSELVVQGYDETTVYELADITQNIKNDHNARNRDNFDNTWQTQEPSQERVEIYECFYHVDFDGDGVGELRRVIYATGSRVILANDPAPFVPYASGTPWINPHRFVGYSMYDRMKEVQDAKTRILRQWLDNQNHANNARVGVVTNLVEMDDVTNSRPGGVIRMDSPDAVVPISVPDIGASCERAMAYLDTVRSERGGASLDLQTRAANVIGDTAQGIERQFSSREQQTADMLRTLSETLVKETYKLVHRAMREFIPSGVEFRARGEFQSTNPSEWPARERVNVKTGLSNSERLNRMQSLQLIIQQQKEFLGAGQGGIFTDDDKLHNALEDWCLFAGIDNPERYWSDPKSEQAQQTRQQLAQQQQQEQQKLDQLARDAITVPAEIDGARLMEDARQHDEDLAFKYVELDAEQEQKEAEIVSDATVTLTQQAMKDAEKRRNSASQ